MNRDANVLHRHLHLFESTKGFREAIQSEPREFEISLTLDKVGIRKVDFSATCDFPNIGKHALPPASITTRSAKSGNDWTENELAAYNITIVPQDSATFFGVDVLPLPSHHLDLLNNATADEMAMTHIGFSAT
jgi:hypothetical protein